MLKIKFITFLSIFLLLIIDSSAFAADTDTTVAEIVKEIEAAKKSQSETKNLLHMEMKKDTESDEKDMLPSEDKKEIDTNITATEEKDSDDETAESNEEEADDGDEEPDC